MDGILNIYKEKGYTSHDVVAKLRGILHQKKIGHTGTLDPDAEGVLPVCLGKATKVCDLLTDKDKVYEAQMQLGITTDTQDHSGQVLMRRDAGAVTEDMLSQTLAGFIGDYQQIPPMYSAIKIGGKKLYDLARAGVTVERPPRHVQIYDISHICFYREDNIYASFTVHCSKGTYIRTLCHDVGEKLGCGACMSALKRTKVSCFGIEHSLMLSQVEQFVKEGTIEQNLIYPDEMFPELPKVYIRDEARAKLLANGNPLNVHPYDLGIKGTDTPLPEYLRVYRADGSFAAIYKWNVGKHMFFPEKMF